MTNKQLVLVLNVILVIAFIGTSAMLFQEISAQEQEKKIIRLGYFPNINHAQAVIGVGNGTFQKYLGDNVELKTYVFNAGPSAIEALFANQVDATYVGPNPAINGYVISKGTGLKIISGASSGGAVFVVRNDSGINTINDLGNKKFASPQLGNTQDVALREYLISHGFNTVEKGGNVSVIPVKNADILTLLLKKEIDGAWVPEPWGERFIKEGNSKLFVDERDLWPDGKFVTAHIIAKPDYLKNNPDVIKKLLNAHIDITNWINNNKDDAIKLFNIELKKITGQTIDEDVLKKSLERLDLTYDPIQTSLYKSAESAFKVGFLKTNPDLSGIYDLALQNEVLSEKGLQQIINGGKNNTSLES